MSKPLLLLHNRFTADDSDIWRVAIRRGWKTERTNMYQVKEHIGDCDHVRYYGNTLHAKQIEDQLPISFTPIPYEMLTKLPEYTKRRVNMISFGSLYQPLKQTMFIKPVREKWFEAKVYKAGEMMPETPLDKDDIYVSEVIKFTDEVRCFVLDGEVLTSSYYRINSIVWDQTDEDPTNINFDNKISDTNIPSLVRDIYRSNTFPRGVVFDFCLLESGEWALVEFNEAWACGLYYSDPEKCFDVIINSQHDNLTVIT